MTLRVKDVASLTGMTAGTVRRWIAEGRLDAEKDESGRYALTKSHVNAILEEKRPHFRDVSRCVLSLSNNKGGVGKTATAVNLARELARDYSVLLADLDPQANATAATVENLRRHSFADCVMDGLPVEELIVQGEQFDVLPSHISLERLEIESPAPQADLIPALNDALAPVDDYNFIIIDTLPSLGLLQRMAICAADGVLIPVRASTFAIDGIYNLQQLILTMQRLHGARAELFGIVLTMFDSRKTMCRAIKEALNEEFPDNAFESVIRENTAVDQALSLGLAASDFAAGSAGALDYSTFTAEVIRHVPQTTDR